ncbi:probable DNA-directed RNA polymerases I and III subunit RPAC2 [Cryptotermes secundus]|uniref:probable DNA-directed RNA polymerases I and III subunit RPAC2 n=1 Tax=Cryptotermes secundus TaxID=105785 RepID=UPI000CD7C92A|nr:probable DNA-directed RNA polymerases I and III subunit RPAC2 [Cryptotermes secundus]
MSLIAELAGDELDKKSRTFVFKEGGHTFGNALRCIISRYPDVTLCGYTIPHPSETAMHFRIQTTGSAAVDVLKQGIEDLEKLCDHTLTVFQDEMTQFKAAN